MTLTAAASSIKGSFETGVLVGSKAKPTKFSYTVPYKEG